MKVYLVNTITAWAESRAGLSLTELQALFDSLAPTLRVSRASGKPVSGLPIPFSSAFRFRVGVTISLVPAEIVWPVMSEPGAWAPRIVAPHVWTWGGARRRRYYIDAEWMEPPGDRLLVLGLEDIRRALVHPVMHMAGVEGEWSWSEGDLTLRYVGQVIRPEAIETVTSIRLWMEDLADVWGAVTTRAPKDWRRVPLPPPDKCRDTSVEQAIPEKYLWP